MATKAGVSSLAAALVAVAAIAAAASTAATPVFDELDDEYDSGSGSGSGDAELPTSAPTPGPTTAQHHLNANNIVGAITCGQQVAGNTTEHASTGNRAHGHWYTFEVTAAAADGALVLNSCGSGFDTGLWLYSVDGDELSPRPINSCDDCGDCGTRAVLRTNAVALPAGRYALLVEGHSRSYGSYVVAMQCPALMVLAPSGTTTALSTPC